MFWGIDVAMGFEGMAQWAERRTKQEVMRWDRVQVRHDVDSMEHIYQVRVPDSEVQKENFMNYHQLKKYLTQPQIIVDKGVGDKLVSVSARKGAHKRKLLLL